MKTASIKTKIIVAFVCLAYGAGFLHGMVTGGKKAGAMLSATKKKVRKYKHLEETYDLWMMAKEYGVSLDQYLLQKGISSVAIYGASLFGLRLYHELKDTSVEVVCILDQKASLTYPEVRAVQLEKCGGEQLCPADAVIVADFIDWKNLRPRLTNAGYKQIIALDTLLYDLLDEKCERFTVGNMEGSGTNETKE